MLVRIGMLLPLIMIHPFSFLSVVHVLTNFPCRIPSVIANPRSAFGPYPLLKEQ